jgi:hypothetical protein
VARRGRLANRRMIKVQYSGVNGSGAIVVGGSNDDGPPAAAPSPPLSPSWIEVELDVHAYMSKLQHGR